MKLIMLAVLIILISTCSIVVYALTTSLISIMICLLLVFIVTEIVLRVIVVGELHFGWQQRVIPRIARNSVKPKMLSFESHPYALYVKVPNSDGLYPSNNYGYVGKKPVQLKKSDGVIRIYVAGGSTAERIDSEHGPDSHWPAKMEKFINDQLKGGTTIEVINAAVSAYTSAESLSEFAFRGVDFKPDVLLIYHNINDAWTSQMVDGFKNDYSHARKHKNWKLSWVHSIPLMRFLITYQLFYSEFIQKYDEVHTVIHHISNLPWKSTEVFESQRVYAFKRNIRNMIAIAQCNDIKPVIIKWEFDWDSPWVPPCIEGGGKNMLLQKLIQYIKANNNALEEVAKECGILYIDVGHFTSDNFSDHIHFNTKGLEEMALRVGNHLLPIVKDLICEKY